MKHSMFSGISCELALISFLSRSHSDSRRRYARGFERTFNRYRFWNSSAKCSANKRSKLIPPSSASWCVASTYNHSTVSMCFGTEVYRPYTGSMLFTAHIICYISSNKCRPKCQVAANLTDSQPFRMLLIITIIGLHCRHAVHTCNPVAQILNAAWCVIVCKNRWSNKNKFGSNEGAQGRAYLIGEMYKAIAKYIQINLYTAKNCVTNRRCWHRVTRQWKQTGRNVTSADAKITTVVHSKQV